MKRLLPLIALLLVASVGCSPSDPYAAIVNGEVIPASVVEEELAAVKASPSYAEQLNQQLSAQGGLQPGGDNTLNATYTAQILFVRVLAELLDQDLKRRGLTVSEDVRKQTEETIRSQNDPAVFDGLAPAYRDYIVTTQAQLETALNSRNTPEEQRRYYDANPTEFAQTCFRQLSVPTEAAAEQIRARVTAGEDFTAIARQLFAATSPGQPDTGVGEATCASGEELSALANSVLDPLQPNQVSAPLNNGGEFVLVQLVSRSQQTFEQAQPQISAKLTNSDALVADLLESAKLKVNPRYGVYRSPNAEQGQSGGIVPSETKVLQDGKAEDPSQSGGGLPPGEQVPVSPAG